MILIANSLGWPAAFAFVGVAFAVAAMLWALSFAHWCDRKYNK